MVSVEMSYQVVPGKEADFETVFRAVLQALEGMPQHLGTRLYRECGASDYLVVSDWLEREAFEELARSRLFRKLVDWGFEDILRGRPALEIYEKEDPWMEAEPAEDGEAFEPIRPDRAPRNGSSREGEGWPVHTGPAPERRRG